MAGASGLLRGAAAWPLRLALLAAAADAGSLHIRGRSRRGRPLIPNTDVEMPENWEDYTRGRVPWKLFPGGSRSLPGMRVKHKSLLAGVPDFDPSDAAASPEAYVHSSSEDPVSQRCAPGGKPTGHQFYNVWTPELLPFVVPLGTPNRTDAAVIIAPGGGALHLAWETDGISSAEWLNSLGISAFVLKYRVPDRSQRIMLMDAQRAVSLVRSRAAKHGLNPLRIGFMGFSAGGMLTINLAASHRREYHRVDAIDNVPFHPDFILLLFPQIPKVHDLVSVPRTFMAFTEDDPCCPASYMHIFADAMRSVDPAPIFVKDYATGGHGWGTCDWYPFLRGKEVCGWKDLAKTWLQEQVLTDAEKQ